MAAWLIARCTAKLLRECLGSCWSMIASEVLFVTLNQGRIFSEPLARRSYFL
jgi:hypothetical protein